MEDQTRRQYWLGQMDRICRRVLEALERERLRRELPAQFHPDRAPFAPLEALGRTACGIAPWLELEGLAGEEGKMQWEYRRMLLAGMANAVNPESPDYMVFTGEMGRQPLVDAGFLAHALLRAPKALGAELKGEARSHVAAALKSTRAITPWRSNWLLFSAVVEAALYLLGEDWDALRVDSALHTVMDWYQGDGVYGDGPDFRWDYYNSFVIHPMLTDILRLLADENERYREWLPVELARAGRYAALLERMIAPDGSYPVAGRSAAYRFGTFHLLAQACLQGFLPVELAPAQAREGLTAVMEKVMETPGNFDRDGWLRPGVCGFQPSLAEAYISTGSLYLCAAVFLPLGLPPAHEFWSGPDRAWTSRRIWAGEDVPADHAAEV